jgi:hypothetical protein
MSNKEKPCYELDKKCQDVHACWDGPCLFPVRMKRGDETSPPKKAYFSLSEVKRALNLSDLLIKRYAADYGVEILKGHRVSAADVDRLILIVEQEKRPKADLIRQVLRYSFPQTFKHLKS